MEGDAPSLSPASAARKPLGTQNPARRPGSTPKPFGDVFHPMLRMSVPNVGPAKKQRSPSAVFDSAVFAVVVVAWGVPLVAGPLPVACAYAAVTMSAASV